MYIKTDIYNVMDGEPALGKMEETELIAEKFEIEDYIINDLFDNGTYPGDWKFYPTDDYTDEEIEIDAADYIDLDLLPDFLDENSTYPIEVLYALAFVDAPNSRARRKK